MANLLAAQHPPNCYSSCGALVRPVGILAHRSGSRSGLYRCDPFGSRTIIGDYQVLDNRLGWTVKPKGRARVVREGIYDVWYEIGPEGFRRTIPDAETSRHIYVLGDSFAFGWGVNDHETFSSRLAWHQRDQAKVVNLGVEGHGITQIYVRFNQVQANIQTGDIVIFTAIGDDVHRSWPDFVFVSRMLFGRKPLQYFPVFDIGTIRIEQTDSYSNKVKALLLYAPWMGSLFSPLLLPSAGKAMEDAAHMIEKVRDSVEGRGAKFLLVQLPTGGELRANQVVLDLSTFGALQLRSRFPTDHESLRLCFISDDDGHYSPRGHRLVGDVLQEELIKRGWVVGSRL